MPRRRPESVAQENIRMLKSGRATRTCRRLLEAGQAEAIGYFSPNGVYSVDVAEAVVYRHLLQRAKLPTADMPNLGRPSDFSKWLNIVLKTTGFFSS